MKEMRIALRNAGKIDPHSIDDYINAGGYEALKKAREIPQDELILQFEKSGLLRGRGGAGFNTGFKWRTAKQVDSDIKYVVCNADEGEPGTYKDRTILENDPHTVLEGMAICAYAIGADKAIVYCRAEYPFVIDLLKEAVAQGEAKGIYGNLKFTIMTGAGAYVCGEETALLNSIEGKRGEARLKPPYPTVKGLYGKPTVVNNVETFAAVATIVNNGPVWYSSIGAIRYPGTKVFTVSGDITEKGWCEVYTGSKLSEILDHFGGVRAGHQLKAVQIGGNSGAFVTPDQLDTRIDIESLSELGLALGSGSLFVMDETRDMSEILVEVVAFFAAESCGKCTPCREGTVRILELLTAIRDGQGQKKDLDTIEKLCKNMQVGSFCPLGQSVAVPVMSALTNYRQDFLNHIH